MDSLAWLDIANDAQCDTKRGCLGCLCNLEKLHFCVLGMVELCWVCSFSESALSTLVCIARIEPLASGLIGHFSFPRCSRVRQVFTHTMMGANEQPDIRGGPCCMLSFFEPGLNSRKVCNLTISQGYMYFVATFFFSIDHKAFRVFCRKK